MEGYGRIWIGPPLSFSRPFCGSLPQEHVVREFAESVIAFVVITVIFAFLASVAGITPNWNHVR